MKIYDISQEVLGCRVYPGDPKPERQIICSMENGDMYNLTAFSMCAHNGTHIDAPRHFIKDGAGVEGIPLCKTVGAAFVAAHNREVTEEDVKFIMNKARAACRESAKRILLKGNAVVSNEAARAFAEEGIYLIGVESQSVGEENAPAAAHRVLLGQKVVLLEGIRLDDVDEGVYFLNAAPLKLGGSDGAPCRAVLVDLGEMKFD